MTRNNLGPDPSQWSNSNMTGVGISIAGGVAGMMTSALVAAATGGGRPPGKGYSAKKARLSNEEVLRLDNDLMILRLQHSQTQTKEAVARATAAEERDTERLYWEAKAAVRGQ
jgi:hypothetical protein